MIIFIGPRRQTHLLRTMRRDARMPRWRCRTYAWLFRTPLLPAATYILVGVDRLDMAERRLAAQMVRHINALGPGWRALNDPAIGMGRFRLLRRLHEAGTNDFNAYLAAEETMPRRYPVFIRRNSSSLPPLTGLIADEPALRVALAGLREAGEVPEDLVIIEYCAEPVRPGLFVKHSAYRVGAAIIPTPGIYAAGWMVKVSNTVDVADELTAADVAILRDNPFADVARQAFDLAGIDYGRADIGLVGGRPQIYEINYNPDVRTQAERPNRNARLSALWHDSDTQFFTALREVDGRAAGWRPSLSTAELAAFRMRFWRNYAPQRY